MDGRVSWTPVPPGGEGGGVSCPPRGEGRGCPGHWREDRPMFGALLIDGHIEPNRQQNSFFSKFRPFGSHQTGHKQELIHGYLLSGLTLIVVRVSG